MTRKINIKITTVLTLFIDDNIAIPNVMNDIHSDYYSTNVDIVINKMEMTKAEIQFVSK